MLKQFIPGLAGVMLLGALAGCNSEEEPSELTSTNVEVTSFYFKNSERNPYADSVFFSIDLANAQIFNADSLPYGYDVTRMVPYIATGGAKNVELEVSRSGKADTVYNYTTNSTDSIDFTHPVKLRLLSLSGTVERTYTITVNVHKVKADSLVWDRQEMTALPTPYAAPVAQRTVQMNETLYCMSTDGSTYAVARNSNPAEWQWETASANIPQDADINTLAATDRELFMLTESGELIKSEDGREWTSTGSVNWAGLYGGFESVIYGAVKLPDGTVVLESYPSRNCDNTLPEGMPVSGTSVPVTYHFEYSMRPMMIICGGRQANGELSDRVWGFDGYSFIELSVTPMLKAMTDMTVIPYFAYRESTYWKSYEYPALVAMGGVTADGKQNDTVYISYDYGMNWRKAGALMQLPDYLKPFSHAQAYVYKSTLTDAQQKSVWRKAGRNMPQWRVIKPVTEWECPYIYLFGGIQADGQLSNTVWRAVINRLTFKPII